MSKISKKYIAALAGLLILLYHCWIPVFRYGTFAGSVERFIVSGSFVGVDLFFFISAYSLASRPVSMKKENGVPKEYLQFLLNRALKILPLFVVALILDNFLWFLPAIMIMYIVFPPLFDICKNKAALSLPLLIAGWAGLTGLILGVLKPSQDFGIFLFRIPVIILGGYMGGASVLEPSEPDVFIKDEEGTLIPKPNKKRNIIEIVLGAVLLGVGIWLVYHYAYLSRLNKPFKGTFYLIGIPEMLGAVMLIDGIPRGAPSRIVQYFGSMTLEMYFFQMVLGSFLIDSFYKVFGLRLLTNIAVIAVVIMASYLLHRLAEFIGELRKPKQNQF